MTFDVTQIENPKKLKHKGRPKIPKSTNQGTLQDDKNFESSTSKKQVNETDNENFIPKVAGRHCSNCYGTGHYASTCTFSKNHFR
ncbi:hypothetical protein C2G38_2172491 [Gigaspora rosea]|uniref:CCHC-type domain-containing protein n=1 Tax=Gigaspora rosea TaxID=44941 RepID=A0A397VKJ3_9GLOM|nr:hypothetical protein C2G38_2172491 [Gigaspora rosea]